MSQKDRRILKQFYNCRILRDHAILIEDLWVRDGRIVDPEKIFYDEKIKPDVRIDCNGALISPGYIDLQINGTCKYIYSCIVIFLRDVCVIKNGVPLKTTDRYIDH